ELEALVPGFEAWLREQFKRNVGYDQMVRELIALPVKGYNIEDLFRNPYQVKATPHAFYVAGEAKPENLAASTARRFVGVRSGCRQCADHPFAKWKREEFWGFAAFYGGLSRQRQGDDFFGPIRELNDRRELNIPNKEQVVQARFLDGA